MNDDPRLEVFVLLRELIMIASAVAGAWTLHRWFGAVMLLLAAALLFVQLYFQPQRPDGSRGVVEQIESTLEG